MSDTVTSTEAVAAPEYPMDRSGRCPFAPPPEVMELAAAAPLSRVRIWDGSTPWLITGYETGRELFADSRVSVDDRKTGFPHWNEHMLSTVDKRPRSVFTSDAEEHTRFRRMLSKPFTFKRVEGLRSAIQKVTDECIDAVLAGPQPADLVTALALPVPTVVISEMLGVPYEDHEFFQKWSLAGLDASSTMEEKSAATGTLFGYMFDLVARKEREPGDDLVSRLITDHVAAGELSLETAAMNAVIMLQAGHETSASMISLGTLALLQDPAAFARLRDAEDPTIAADTVEELMRYLTVVHSLVERVALEDCTIAGQDISAGDVVLMNLPAGNWDPAFVDDPETFDPTRGARGHLGFGYGAHQCIGANLARVEMQIALSSLVRRLPGLRLAVPVEELRFQNEQEIFGIEALPVTW